MIFFSNFLGLMVKVRERASRLVSFAGRVGLVKSVEVIYRSYHNDVHGRCGLEPTQIIGAAALTVYVELD